MMPVFTAAARRSIFPGGCSSSSERANRQAVAGFELKRCRCTRRRRNLPAGLDGIEPLAIELCRRPRADAYGIQEKPWLLLNEPLQSCFWEGRAHGAAAAPDAARGRFDLELWSAVGSMSGLIFSAGFGVCRRRHPRRASRVATSDDRRRNGRFVQRFLVGLVWRSPWLSADTSVPADRDIACFDTPRGPTLSKSLSESG